MTDSEGRDDLATKREQNDSDRIEAVKRWAAYVRENPPEKWGPQLNELVNAQVRSARESDLPAEHYRRVADADHERDG